MTDAAEAKQDATSAPKPSPDATPTPASAPTRRGKSETDPKAFFAAIFETVLEEVERNPDFAERLAQRIGDPVTLVVKGRKKRGASLPPELETMDLKAALEELGQIELRDRLGAYTNAQLGALAKARMLTSEPVSKLNKTQLLNLIIRGLR